ncbi:MAG: ferredoxin family protein [Epulopiscium sp.]|jgi:2-oxoglutarate ferredoxin oxidoreductase subunit delta|nr:ferredoxin family protein [Candidatus Epulonipiscium sp.]
MAKGKVSINEFYCKGCELCVSVCPKNVLKLSETKINEAGYNPAEVVSDDCIACTSCAKMCPEVAITVEKIG